MIEETERAIVAKGRSLEIPHPTDKRGLRYGDNGPILLAATIRMTEGQEVELPVDEIATLRKSGHLVDPDNLPPPTGKGWGQRAGGL